MSKGNFTGATLSAEIIAADAHRDYLTIQKTNTTQIALGLGEAAVTGEGIQLINVGSSIELYGVEARMAIFAIGNGGTGTYQSGRMRFRPGPYAA